MRFETFRRSRRHSTARAWQSARRGRRPAVGASRSATKWCAPRARKASGELWILWSGRIGRIFPRDRRRPRARPFMVSLILSGHGQQHFKGFGGLGDSRHAQWYLQVPADSYEHLL